MSTVKAKDVDLGLREVKRQAHWILCGKIPKKVEDLPFVGTDSEGRFNWWTKNRLLARA